MMLRRGCVLAASLAGLAGCNLLFPFGAAQDRGRGPDTSRPDAPNRDTSRPDSSARDALFEIPAPNLKNGLVEYWPLDEPGGDAKGLQAGKTLAAQGTIGSATGKVYSTAREWTAANASSRLTRAADPDLHFGDVDVTYAIWFNQYTTQSGQNECLYHYLLSDSEYKAGTGIRIGGANDLQLVSGNPSGYDVLGMSLPEPANNAWHLAILWYTAADDTLHGRIDDGPEHDEPGHARGDWSGGRSFDLGHDMVGNCDNGMEGRIGPVAIWRRALTPAEQSLLWNGGKGLRWNEL